MCLCTASPSEICAVRHQIGAHDEMSPCKAKFDTDQSDVSTTSPEFGNVKWSPILVLIIFTVYQLAWNATAIWRPLFQSICDTWYRGVAPSIVTEFSSLVLSFTIKGGTVLAIAVALMVSRTPPAAIGINRAKDSRKRLSFVLPALWLFTIVVATYKSMSVQTCSIEKGGSPLPGDSVRALVVATFVLRTVAGPICEEVIFRAFIFLTARRYLKLPLAVLVSALIFGAIHYNGGLQQQTIAFFLGVLFCWFYERCQSLPQVILLHSTINVWRVILALSQGHL